MRPDVAALLAALFQISACYRTQGWMEAAEPIVANHLDAARTTDNGGRVPAGGSAAPAPASGAKPAREVEAQGAGPERLDRPAAPPRASAQQMLFAPIGKPKRLRDPG